MCVLCVPPSYIARSKEENIAWGKMCKFFWKSWNVFKFLNAERFPRFLRFQPSYTGRSKLWETDTFLEGLNAFCNQNFYVRSYSTIYAFFNLSIEEGRKHREPGILFGGHWMYSVTKISKFSAVFCGSHVLNMALHEAIVSCLKVLSHHMQGNAKHLESFLSTLMKTSAKPYQLSHCTWTKQSIHSF